MFSIPTNRIKSLLAAGAILACALTPVTGKAAGYGKLAGVVSDNKGTPLMGASVLIVGPSAFGTEGTAQTAERMLTDAHGRFTVAHLLPGWYSLNVSSPTRLPAMRNGVHVGAGETAIASFILTDVMSSVRFQMPTTSVSSWGDDWKWVLRASSTTRPILRYKDLTETKDSTSKKAKGSLPRGSLYAGILPGGSRSNPLAEDFGPESVFAYSKPLSPDVDILTEASFAPLDMNAGTVGMAMRRNLAEGGRQEIGLAIHQFDVLPGSSSSAVQTRGMEARFSETRLLAPHLSVTTGLDLSYLSAIDNVFIAQPRLGIEYQATPQTVIAVQYGSGPEAGSSITDRLSLLNAFPQVSERDGRLSIQRLNHGEIAVNRRFGKSARAQIAVYRDTMHDAAIWGYGMSAGDPTFAGNALPNPVGSGIAINAGNYSSSGFHAVLAKTFASRVEVLGAVSSGTALSAQGINLQQTFASGSLRPEQTTVFIGKVTTQLPISRTRVSASYEYTPNDRVTMVDPALQGSLETQPYLGAQIRQPIPTPNSWPVRIDAVAEFQNLLSQGYVPAGQGNHKPVILTSGYHAVRGGLSVQF